MAYICLDAGALDVFISDTPERQEAIWSTRGVFLEAIHASTSEMDECDVVVPRSEVAKFVKYVDTLHDKVDMRIMGFGHAGDGNLHLYALRDELPEDEWKAKLHQVFQYMYDKGKEFKGKVSGEHGIGFAKKPYLEESLGEQGAQLMRNIKHAFDSRNILNPGKVI